MRNLSTAVVAALPLGLASLAHGDLITNGGFETGDFTGWSQWGDPGGTSVSNASHGGAFSGWFGPSNNFGGIRQTLAVGADQTVHLSFWLANGGGPVNALQVKLEGVTLLSFAGSQAFGYTEYTFEHTAAAANPVLEFGFFHRPAHFRLDDVSAMVVVPLPPGAFGGLIGLAGAAGLVGYRRRRTVH